MLIANLTIGDKPNFYKEIEVSIPAFAAFEEDAVAMINKYNAIELIKHLTTTFDISEQDIKEHVDYENK